MQREILFRGKSIVKEDDSWYYGSLFTMANGELCLRVDTEKDSHIIPVIKETVGQLFHKAEDGTKFFEGDYVTDETGAKYLIYWDELKLGFSLNQQEGAEAFSFSMGNIRLLGNVIDN